MAETKPAEKTIEEQRADAQEVPGVVRVADADKKPAGSKPYRSDRAYAEVDADEVVYLDPKSEVGKRLLATGNLTEVEDPLA